MTEIIPPMVPETADGWACTGPAHHLWNSGYTAYTWRHPASGVYVISAVEVPDRKRGPEYHLSMSQQGRFGPGRCDRNMAKMVCKAFGMEDAEEDNHVPNGVVRNFWLPVAQRLIGAECPCKATEPAIVEDKGDYVWRGAPE